MGYSLTRSFPYAAAAVLAARRYARPAPKWRGGRQVSTALATLAVVLSLGGNADQAARVVAAIVRLVVAGLR